MTGQRFIPPASYIANFPAAARHPAVRSHNSRVSEIKLSGGEITILKTLGLTGAPMAGTQLVDRIEEMEGAEFLDTLTGLIAHGLRCREQGQYSHHGIGQGGLLSRQCGPFPRIARSGLSVPAREAGYGTAAAAVLIFE